MGHSSRSESVVSAEQRRCPVNCNARAPGPDGCLAANAICNLLTLIEATHSPAAHGFATGSSAEAAPARVGVDADCSGPRTHRRVDEGVGGVSAKSADATNAAVPLSDYDSWHCNKNNPFAKHRGTRRDNTQNGYSGLESTKMSGQGLF